MRFMIKMRGCITAFDEYILRHTGESINIKQEKTYNPADEDGHLLIITDRRSWTGVHRYWCHADCGNIVWTQNGTHLKVIHIVIKSLYYRRKAADAWMGHALDHHGRNI